MSPRVSRKSGNRVCDRCYVPFPLLFISDMFRFVILFLSVLFLLFLFFICLSYNFVLSLVICFALFHLFRFFSPFFYFIIYPSSSHQSSIEIYVLKYIIIFIITIIILLSYYYNIIITFICVTILFSLPVCRFRKGTICYWVR